MGSDFGRRSLPLLCHPSLAMDPLPSERMDGETKQEEHPSLPHILAAQCSLFKEIGRTLSTSHLPAEELGPCPGVPWHGTASATHRHTVAGARHGGSEAAGERGITQQKTLGTALSWKSAATDMRMGEMSSHLPLVFFLFFFFPNAIKGSHPAGASSHLLREAWQKLETGS